MLCEKCGNELSKGAKFCGKCGAVIGSKTQEESTVENMVTPQDVAYLDISSYSQLSDDPIYIEPDEQLLGTLGNGWITNMLFHKLKKCNAILTNKRLYLQGTFFSGGGKSLISNRYEKVIDLEDITGTGFHYGSSIGIGIYLLLVIVGIIGGIYFGPATQDSWEFAWVCYGMAAIVAISYSVKLIKSRKTQFFIEYPGGSICFDASIIGIAEVRDFQKQICRAKDKVKGKI